MTQFTVLSFLIKKFYRVSDMKIVINQCFGGFGLSDQAIQRYGELARLNLVSEEGGLFGLTWYLNSVDDKNYFSAYDIPRDDPNLIQVVEELEELSWGPYSELTIVEIPDDVKWTIEKYDGNEHISEVHRTWC